MQVPVASTVLLLLAVWCSCTLLCSCIQYPVQDSTALEKQLVGVSRSLQTTPNILFVSLLNGKLVAVDADSGISLWTFDTGAPLISSKVTHPLDADIFLDATDGGLYVYRPPDDLADPAEPTLEKLAITLPELVEAAPSLAEDGSLLLGNRRSTVYLLDTATGQLLSTFSDTQGSLEDRSAAGLDDKVASGKLLILGRQDFGIRSQRVGTGQDMWNATFSRLHLLNPTGQRHKAPVLEAFLRGIEPEQLEAIGHIRHPSTHPGLAPAPAPIPRLAAGLDNSLQAFDREDFKQWSILFDAPPIAAYSPLTGATNFLKPPTSSAPPPLPAPHPSDPTQPAPTVLVGHLSDGSKYAIQAGHLVLDPDTLPPTPTTPALPAPSDTTNQTVPPTALEPPSTAPSVLPYTDNPHNPLSSLTCPSGFHTLTPKPTKTPPPFLPPPRTPRTPRENRTPSPSAPPPGAAATQDPKFLAESLRFRLQVMYAMFAAVCLFVLLLVLWYFINRILPSPRPAPAADVVAAAQAILAHHQATLVSQGKASAPGIPPITTPSTPSFSDPPTHSPMALITRLPSDQSQSLSSDPGAPSPTSIRTPTHPLSTNISPTPIVSTPPAPPLPAVMRRQVDADGAVLVGRLRVGPNVLGYGSAGTVVYEGRLDGRPVAVKRMLRQFYEIARKEIGLLIVSDEHPNVVRCFAMEEDEEFVYLALERCRSTLSDLLGTAEGRARFIGPGGQPTAFCLMIMHDIASGLGALHERGIVHRDLKPHNVLITESGRAKLSDMGLSKQLGAEQSSFESHGAGGSSGWQAPEQLMAKGGASGAPRQTRAMDVFSLGCVLYYCITGGKHPFGETYERDTNIMRGAPNLVPLQPLPEAANVIATMLKKDAMARPVMTAVLAHPLWWSTDRRLQFLLDASDRVEGEDREPDQSLLEALESWMPAAIGSNWGSSMDPELIANVGKYRRYDYRSLRDLLRVVRNKRNHFRELPEGLQEKMGPLPDGYLAYFCSRFPRLLLAVMFFALERLQDDPTLARYWPPDPAAFEPCRKVFQAQTQAAAAAQATTASRARGTQRPPLSPPPASPPPTAPEAIAAAAAAAAPAAEPSDASAAGEASVSRKGSGESADLVASDGSVPVVGWDVVDDLPELQFKEFPKRPGKQLCDFFLKTGHCKYGDECIFDHPEQHAVGLTMQGFPYRPGNQLCSFFLKNNHCKFGPACKFHHPPLRPIYAGSTAGADASPLGVEVPAASAS